MVRWVEAGYGGVARRCGSGMPDRGPVGLASACPRAGPVRTGAGCKRAAFGAAFERGRGRGGGGIPAWLEWKMVGAVVASGVSRCRCVGRVGG